MVIKKTQEQFLKEAYEIHGDLYDYKETEYLGREYNIKIFCKTCKKSFCSIKIILLRITKMPFFKKLYIRT